MAADPLKDGAGLKKISSKDNGEKKMTRKERIGEKGRGAKKLMLKKASSFARGAKKKVEEILVVKVVNVVKGRAKKR